MKQKILILLAVIAVFASGCNINDKKPMEESRDMRNNVEQDRNKPLNVQYNDQTPANMTDVDYAKWGRMALEETKKKYPNSEVSDYEYDTRRVAPDGTITDFFDFTVLQDGKKRLIKVGVMHTNEKLIDMKFEEMT